MVRAETLAEVIAAIHRDRDFRGFAAPRTLAEIAGSLAGRSAVWIAFGPDGGAVVTLGASGEASSVPIAATIEDLRAALAATLVDKPTDEAYVSLRTFALRHVVPQLPLTASETPPVVVPVGLAAWLLERSKPPSRTAAGGSLIAHSHGRPGLDPRLTAALEEVRAVARVLPMPLSLS